MACAEPRSVRSPHRPAPAHPCPSSRASASRGPPHTRADLLECAAPMVFAIDLEGVLAPEIWPALGEHFGIPDLHLTTRDLGDFDELMRRRVAATRSRKLRLKELQEVAYSVEPFLGAREFLARLRAMGQVVII